MEIECRQSGQACVVKPLERRMDARCASEFRRELAELIAQGQERIVLDVSDVDFIDSSALGAIVANFKALQGKGDLVIAGARAPVMTLFRVTRIDKVIRMFSTAGDALAAVA
jgi:anti-sigma B factor antagonist